MILFFGYVYIFIGLIFLTVPLIYLELGRPKDLIKAFLNLIIGIVLIFKNRSFETFSYSIYLLITILFVLYVIEIFLTRWNQLTEQEKIKLTTLLELKKNLQKLIDALLLGFSNFKNSLFFLKFNENNKNINQKKWVRNDKNDNIKS